MSCPSFIKQEVLLPIFFLSESIVLCVMPLFSPVEAGPDTTFSKHLLLGTALCSPNPFLMASF